MEPNDFRQPLGVFPYPLGLLLIEPRPEAEPARAALVEGKAPEAWPTELEALRLAHAGRIDEAAEAFAVAGGVTGPYNHFVLMPEGIDPDSVKESLPAQWAPLVDVVRYTIGDTDTLPEATGAGAEVQALVGSTRATAQLAEGRVEEAVALLLEAADAIAGSLPVLAAQLRGNAGAILAESDGIRAEGLLRQGLDGLSDAQLPAARAELFLQLGLVLHARAAADGSPLNPAVHQYHSALQLIGRDASPYTWAAANLNLAAAYLTMPMTQASDQLRSGIAMQCLRSALEVFTPEEYPQEWASAEINLANALVYTPSTHQGDNLVEAVERYEKVLAVRDRETDPLGRARLLTNQGNALAHLGIFDHAKSKLVEARFLFEEQLDHSSAMTVRSILDEIAKQSVPSDARSEAAPSEEVTP